MPTPTPPPATAIIDRTATAAIASGMMTATQVKKFLSRFSQNGYGDPPAEGTTDNLVDFRRGQG